MPLDQLGLGEPPWPYDLVPRLLSISDSRLGFDPMTLLTFANTALLGCCLGSRADLVKGSLDIFFLTERSEFRAHGDSHDR